MVLAKRSGNNADGRQVLEETIVDEGVLEVVEDAIETPDSAVSVTSVDVGASTEGANTVVKASVDLRRSTLDDDGSATEETKT